MKKIILLITFLVLSLTAFTAYAVDKKQAQDVTTYLKQGDITGDKKEDLIEIRGTPFEEGSLFLKEITLKIKTSEGKTLKSKLDAGYEPAIKFNDLNHDKINDILLRVETGESGGSSNYYLYTAINAKQEELPVPEPLSIISQFEEGYKAMIKIDATGESHIFDLSDRKAKYDQLGLYNEGKLNEPMELIVSPYSTLKPVKISKDKNKTGLRGVQRISGVANNDTIGFVESSWVYENGKWRIIDTSIRKNSKTKQKKQVDVTNPSNVT
ncbi:hypothetical protein SAMN05192533_101270 [Mesobacillus persicus]|uniref:Uncharacterized protein n=1 Tax=Mesobacillus persicus TaxID=930146 RepID=A0A1H7W533_9BACI|nr:hypothetical protein [Mesobacillus persicus]SEM16591.1 hypothetical protein SAMN05192533_101270 [Mesobacillus persicus]